MVAAAPEARPAALPQDDDAELVIAVRRGDDHAFERLYARYHRRIAAYVRGMVKDYARAEDITQEVFISALRRLRSSEQDIALKPWLYEIARNACIDQYRRTQRAPEVLLDTESPESEPLVSIGPTPDIQLDTKQKLDHLRHAFSGLSEVQHEVLVMRELEGRSYREIGERLNLTRPAVESALFRARRRLMEEYEELSSGSRCIRIQRAINLACTGTPGARDRWRIASHVSHCHVCRRHARLSGLSPEYTPATLPARVAAILPLPAFLRRFFVTRGSARVGSIPADHVSSLASVASSVSSAAEPISGWITAGAVAATVALAVGGSSLVGNTGTPHHRAFLAPAAPAAAVVHQPAATSAGSGAAANARRHSGAPVSGGRRHGGRSSAATGAAGSSTSSPSVASTKPHTGTAARGSQPANGSGGGLPVSTPVSAPAPSSAVQVQPSSAVKTVTNAASAVGQAGSTATDTTSKSVPSAVTNAASQVQKAVNQVAQGTSSTAAPPLPAPLGTGH